MGNKVLAYLNLVAIDFIIYQNMGKLKIEMGSGELHMRENITFITQLITWRFEIGQKLLVSSRLEDGLRKEDAPPVLFHHINIVVIGVELDISCALM
ncbi:unnamed protein product [Prunus armeniaca]|uniref:Uncharacterized protein n=1 Tax=Prunus armeniaca TaxID=36596 RepID=A0A6J5WLM2_PRUAR|nr:unnamed protein product [Prunus armeniaca]